MDFTDLIKLLDAGFTKDDIVKLFNSELLTVPNSEPKPEPKPEPEPEPEPKPEPKPDAIGEKLDKLIALTMANNFGAENPFNPNATEKNATDFFANIIAPGVRKEGTDNG